MSIAAPERPGSAPSVDSVAANRSWLRDALWQLFIVACGYIVYSLSVGAVQWLGAEGQRHMLALANARQVVNLERTLHLLQERRLQSAIIGSDLWMQVFNGIYMWAHLPLIVLLAIWLYVFHRPQFRLTRNAVLISGTIALVMFQLIPVAPPRLLPDLGLVDTAARVSGVYDTVEPKVFFNPYAAVPSMHVGWVLLMGLAVHVNARSRLVRWLGLALPVLMAGAVVVTGNHYFLDIVSGVAVALLGLWLARLAERHVYRGARHGRDLSW